MWLYNNVITNIIAVCVCVCVWTLPIAQGIIWFPSVDEIMKSLADFMWWIWLASGFLITRYWDLQDFDTCSLNRLLFNIVLIVFHIRFNVFNLFLIAHLVFILILVT